MAWQPVSVASDPLMLYCRKGAGSGLRQLAGAVWASQPASVAPPDASSLLFPGRVGRPNPCPRKQCANLRRRLLVKQQEKAKCATFRRSLRQ